MKLNKEYVDFHYKLHEAASVLYYTQILGDSVSKDGYALEIGRSYEKAGKKDSLIFILTSLFAVLEDITTGSG